MTHTPSLHERAVQAARAFKTREAELLGILIEVEKVRSYRELGYTSLRSYCLGELDLSESVTDIFVGVAKKSIEVPQIKTLIDSGKLHLTNAKQIARAIRPENQELLLERAQALSSRDLEREICKLLPDLAKKEVLKPISETLTRLILDIEQSYEAKLRQIQDDEAQRQNKHVTLEAILKSWIDKHLEKQNPVRKALRNAGKAIPVARQIGRAIPQAIVHQVNLRDRRQCTFVENSGRRCSQKRWVHRHHVTSISRGGLNSLENLTTLCSAHHRWTHRKENHKVDSIGIAKAIRPQITVTMV